MTSSFVPPPPSLLLLPWGGHGPCLPSLPACSVLSASPCLQPAFLLLSHGWVCLPWWGLCLARMTSGGGVLAE